ncbi:uncharacterized protein LOC144090543 isoform X1 [Stigmatopora argus]
MKLFPSFSKALILPHQGRGGCCSQSQLTLQISSPRPSLAWPQYVVVEWDRIQMQNTLNIIGDGHVIWKYLSHHAKRKPVLTFFPGVERQRAELRIGSWSACGPAEPVGAVRQARTQTHKRLKAATLFSARRQLTSRVGGSAAAMSSNIQVSLDNPYGQVSIPRAKLRGAGDGATVIANPGALNGGPIHSTQGHPQPPPYLVEDAEDEVGGGRCACCYRCRRRK